MKRLTSGGPVAQEKYIRENFHERSRIAELALLLNQIYTNQYSYNPYEKYIHRVSEKWIYCSEEDIRLYKLLVHGITLINRNYRLKEEGRYRTEKQDLMIALDMMGIELIPLLKTTKTNTEYYHLLFRNFNTQAFRRKQAQGYLGLKKTHTCRVLKALEKQKLVAKSGYRNRGYWYQIVLPK